MLSTDGEEQVRDTSDVGGDVALDIPFERDCVVESDPAGVDLAGLLGPYRHRFASGEGQRRRTRVMAPGADGYVPLARVELLGAAFRTLEDSRFFKHDGFDREQIANASGPLAPLPGWFMPYVEQARSARGALRQVNRLREQGYRLGRLPSEEEFSATREPEAPNGTTATAANAPAHTPHDLVKAVGVLVEDEMT